MAVRTSGWRQQSPLPSHHHPSQGANNKTAERKQNGSTESAVITMVILDQAFSMPHREAKHGCTQEFPQIDDRSWRYFLQKNLMRTAATHAAKKGTGISWRTRRLTMAKIVDKPHTW
jgi:hypothetical protein